jgi:autotransporter-associated beta strand protein
MKHCCHLRAFQSRQLKSHQSLLWIWIVPVLNAQIGAPLNSPKMIKLILSAAMVVMALRATATEIQFIGQNNDAAAPIGSVTVAANWAGGVLPAGSVTGVISQTNNVWTSSSWQDLAVRLESGAINPLAGTLNMRGGSNGSGITTRFEIDTTNYETVVNLDLGQLVMWSQYGEKMELNILNGQVQVGTLNLNSSGKGTIHMGNGLFHADAFSQNPVGNINMRAGGTGSVVVDDIAGFNLNGLHLNFETGSRGRVTFGENAGASAGGNFEWMVNNGHVSIDGVVNTDVGAYSIVTDGTSATTRVVSVAFVGENNDPAAPVGAVSVAANWAGGMLPSGESIGAISATANVWSGPSWSNINVRQTGGMIQGTDLELSAGSNYEISDTRTHYADYTNLDLSGELDVGAHLNLLSGHIQAGSLRLNALNTINIHQGIFHVASITTASGMVNFLANGGGALTIDSFDVDPGTLLLNFETGTRGSIAYLDTAFGDIWTSMIASGQVSIDGSISTNVDDFTMSAVGATGFTLSLTPESPWWEDFPRMVSSPDVATVTSLNGSFAMNANGQDPSWGTFYQASGIDNKAASITAFQDAGLKQIGYFETYGQSYSLVAELGAWDEANLTDVLNTHWSWKNYGGGTIRWLGANNFFDDQDFARPYTRTHPRYGGPAMTYPDGSVATGYDGVDTDPRNSRVYDAACSKNIFGELYIDLYRFPTEGSPMDGLVYMAEDDDYAGLLMFKKDAACPLWDDYTYASTLQAADAGIDGMWTDNYGPWDSFTKTPIAGAFGEWSVARFRDYLADTFSANELSAMGVVDVVTFDVRDYMKAVAANQLNWDGDESNLLDQWGLARDRAVWNHTAWLDDAVWWAYVIFKRQTGTEALVNYYATVKAAALAAGKTEFLVTGNDVPGFSLGWCRGDLDMVSSEMKMGWTNGIGESGLKSPPTALYAPFYKLAREHAKSRFVNIWLYDDYNESEFLNPELCNVMYYEMLATHTLPKFDPDNTRVVDPDNGVTNAAFFEFVGEVVPNYGDRVPMEDIGIYYSSSTMLRQFRPGGVPDLDNQPHAQAFWGWGTALGRLHYQYRAVPEWKLTPEMLATLRLLVVPNAVVFDPADVAILTTWLNAGGRLIVTGDSGKYLGESGNFALNPSGGSLNPIRNHANVVYISTNIGKTYFDAFENRTAQQLALFASAMDTALTGAVAAGVVASTVSEQASLTLYEDEAAGKFFIDLNNSALDVDNYTMTSTGTVTIEAVLPQWLRGKALQASVLSPQVSSPVVTLLQPSNTDQVKISLGSVEYYAGLVIEAGPAWADPVVSGSWSEGSNWLQGDVPVFSDHVVWEYAVEDPAISIASPVAVASFSAYRADGATGYWNLNGLQVLNDDSNNGSLTVGSGAGVLDLFDGGWFGARLYIVNSDEAAAADVINAGEIKVRNFLLDTAGTAAGKSYYTHESGSLTIQTQLELGWESVVGNEVTFRQSGGSVTVNHADFGLKLGNEATQGRYVLDGGSASASAVNFAHADSVFEFNHGTFSSGARDVIWQGATGGTLRLAGTGVPTFDVAAGHTLTLNEDIELVDQPGHKGTLVKTGAGTMVLNTASSHSGLIDLQQGVLSLSSGGLDPDLYLHIQAGASVELGFDGINTVRALSFDGGATWVAAGTWGAPSSGAENANSQFSGVGWLQVGTNQVAPTAWTETHFIAEEIAFGLAKDNQDPDGDGISNGQEYMFATDPRDAASVFKMQLATNTGTGVTLTFDTAAERIYSIYFSATLAADSWTKFGEDIPGSNVEIEIEDTVERPRGFYRIEVVQP